MFSMYVWHVHNVETLLILFWGHLGPCYGRFWNYCPILTIVNLNSWQSLWPVNEEWKWTALTIIIYLKVIFNFFVWFSSSFFLKSTPRVIPQIGFKQWIIQWIKYLSKSWYQNSYFFILVPDTFYVVGEDLFCISSDGIQIEGRQCCLVPKVSHNTLNEAGI